MVLIPLYAPVPPAAAAAPDAQSPASQRRQFPAPIRPPARAAATTKPAPAKSGNAPALRARSRRGKTQPPRRQLVTVVAIPRIARVLRASVPVVDVARLRLDFSFCGDVFLFSW